MAREASYDNGRLGKQSVRYQPPHRVRPGAARLFRKLSWRKRRRRLRAGLKGMTG